MKKQDGKTSLQILLTIVILLLIAGAAVAMLFEGTDIVSDIKALLQKDDTKVTETVQDDERISYLTTGIY